MKLKFKFFVGLFGVIIGVRAGAVETVSHELIRTYKTSPEARQTAESVCEDARLKFYDRLALVAHGEIGLNPSQISASFVVTRWSRRHGGRRFRHTDRGYKCVATIWNSTREFSLVESHLEQRRDWDECEAIARRLPESRTKLLLGDVGAGGRL